MRHLYFTSLSIFILFLTSCASNKMTGLWVVENVTVGTQNLTPQARWVRFQKDHTQTSGNGWQQHSIGTWSVDQQTDKLSIVNSNGYKDDYGPFQVKLDKSNMYWQREEDGVQVEVHLKKTTELPQTPGDKLLGIWKLRKVTEAGQDKTAAYNPGGNRYLFIRWDKIFVIRNSPEGTIQGIYHTDGHHPEMEMLFTSPSRDDQKWAISVTTDELTLTSPEGSPEVKMEYQRIDYFPQ